MAELSLLYDEWVDLYGKAETDKAWRRYYGTSTASGSSP